MATLKENENAVAVVELVGIFGRVVRGLVLVRGKEMIFNKETKMKAILLIGFLWFTLTVAAHAESVPVKSPPVTYDPVEVVVTQGQTQQATAEALSSAAAFSDSRSDSHSNSGGNTLSVNEQHVRNAPALGQGSFAIVGCPVAGNAGGSNTNGAAFLGIAFTPAQCYDFMLAQSYQALGAYAAACEVLNTSRAGKRAAKRGVALPVCAPPVPVAPVTPAPLLPAVITVEVKDDAKCTEKVNRVFERCVSK